MQNSKGFSLIEAIIAAAILMTMITTLVPIANLMLKERTILHQKRVYANILHDELLTAIGDAAMPKSLSYTKKVNNTPVQFVFSKEKKLIKGCVSWENVKKQSEEFCLYGHAEQ